ncbi:hypothetical protein JCM24511_03851 [Saitozyma sp. JCM 24511]|nr:hypothetical protein JCM24511_03851 [Saitozyma sp. JCM 24511]
MFTERTNKKQMHRTAAWAVGSGGMGRDVSDGARGKRRFEGEDVYDGIPTRYSGGGGREGGMSTSASGRTSADAEVDEVDGNDGDDDDDDWDGSRTDE